jgi:hypothetical protein
LAKIWGFQKKKATNLPTSSKNLDNFITFFLEIWGFYFEICQKKVPFDHVALLGTFLITR